MPTIKDIRIFEALQTVNFERVLASLAAATIVNSAFDRETLYLQEAYVRIQESLINAVRSTHVDWSRIEEAILLRICREYLNYECIFTTNYDLISYWAIMSQTSDRIRDFFWIGSGPFDLSNTELWGGSKGIYYLHGGLHLYKTSDGRTFKRTRTSQQGNILEAFFFSRTDQIPLFVAEGNSADKMSVIRNSDYLSFAFSSLASHIGGLVIFGHSLGESDNHVVEAINQSRSKRLWISLRPSEGPTIVSEKARYYQKFPDKEIQFFNSATHPLGVDELAVMD